MRLAGRHYQTLQPVEVETDGGRIAAVRAIPQSHGPLPWIAPAFVDLQINGYDGQEFSSPELTPEKVARIVRRQFAFGVARMLPTLTTAGFETFAHGLRAIAAACEMFPDVSRAVPGIHVEGPYISPEDGPRGAHPLQHCRRPDWNEFQRLQEAAGGRIRLLTLSAEYDESPDVIARAVASGVVIALGHTNANSQQIRAAVDAGAALSTHLGNGSHRTLRRHPNYIWDQLAEDRLTASLIVDGHHLPPEVVKTFVRAKTPARCILVSDESGLAGLPPGVYATEMCDLEIRPDGRLVVAGQDQLLAGASEPIGVGVANVMRFAGVDLATAVDMASRQAAELIGEPAGRLLPGDQADLVLFDLERGEDGLPSRLRVRATVTGGELVYEASI